jgi:KaiC/GvpD/RAD55 family RecA-like ATPase
MNANIVLLRLLTEDEYYTKYRDYIDVSSVSEEERIIIKIIDYIFKNNKSIKSINKELLISIFNDNYNNKEKEFKDNIYNIIYNIYNINYNLKDYNLIIINIIKKYILNNIINKSIELIENKDTYDLDTLDTLLQDYKSKVLLLTEEENNIVSDDIDIILETEAGDSGFDWFCDEMNNALGKCKGGDLGLIVANPDAGKTAFILTVAMGLLKSGAKVLHINNEERGSKVKLRAIENLCEMTKAEIVSNKDKVQETIDNYMKGKYFLYDLVSVSIREIKTLIEKHQPDIVIIDQSSKIKVGKQDRNDLTLTEIYKGLRELAKNYNVHIIGVSQADSSAYDKEWLSMDNLFGSKVGVQGELDYIIGIGKNTSDASKENWRYLSFPKNKLTGNNSARVILRLDKMKSKYYNSL